MRASTGETEVVTSPASRDLDEPELRHYEMKKLLLCFAVVVFPPATLFAQSQNEAKSFLLENPRWQGRDGTTLRTLVSYKRKASIQQTPAVFWNLCINFVRPKGKRNALASVYHPCRAHSCPSLRDMCIHYYVNWVCPHFGKSGAKI